MAVTMVKKISNLVGKKIMLVEPTIGIMKTMVAMVMMMALVDSQLLEAVMVAAGEMLLLEEDSRIVRMLELVIRAKLLEAGVIIANLKLKIMTTLEVAVAGEHLCLSNEYFDPLLHLQ